MTLMLCNSCQRHVKSIENCCPFCGAELSASAARVPSRVESSSRGAAAALLVGIGLVACSGAVNSDTVDVGEQGSGGFGVGGNTRGGSGGFGVGGNTWGGAGGLYAAAAGYPNSGGSGSGGFRVGGTGGHTTSGTGYPNTGGRLTSGGAGGVYAGVAGYPNTGGKAGGTGTGGRTLVEAGFDASGSGGQPWDGGVDAGGADGAAFDGSFDAIAPVDDASDDSSD